MEINIIYLNINRLESLHLVWYRMYFGYPKIPNIAVNIFYKKLEITKKKNDSNIIIINNAFADRNFNSLIYIFKKFPI